MQCSRMNLQASLLNYDTIISRLILIRLLPGHPAVVNSEFPGSIGILCVKKNVDGIAFYFAHNTESFVSYHES